MSRLVSISILVAVVALWAILWIPALLRTRRLTVRTVVNRDRDSVYSFVADMPRLLPLFRGANTVESLDVTGKQGYRALITIGQTTFVEDEEILVSDPPRALSWRIHGYGQGVETLTFEESADGATVITDRFESTEAYSNALLGLALFNRLFTWAARRDRRLGWARVKQALENGVA